MGYPHEICSIGTKNRRCEIRSYRKKIFPTYGRFSRARSHTIILRNEKHLKNEKRSIYIRRDTAAKKRAKLNTSGVGKSNNYYEDIYNYNKIIIIIVPP